MNITQTIDFEVEHDSTDFHSDFGYSDKWICKFKYDGRDMEVPFYMGQGHHGAEPKKEDVLDTLFTEAQAVYMTFEEWCDEFGYDSDSIKAKKTFDACEEIGHDLEHLLGSVYDTVREEVYELVG